MLRFNHPEKIQWLCKHKYKIYSLIYIKANVQDIDVKLAQLAQSTIHPIHLFNNIIHIYNGVYSNKWRTFAIFTMKQHFFLPIFFVTYTVIHNQSFECIDIYFEILFVAQNFAESRNDKIMVKQ